MSKQQGNSGRGSGDRRRAGAHRGQGERGLNQLRREANEKRRAEQQRQQQQRRGRA